eukprot:SAG31_NODE_65_length_28565_cov_8.402914_27_plen_101_part_00
MDVLVVAIRRGTCRILQHTYERSDVYRQITQGSPGAAAGARPYMYALYIVHATPRRGAAAAPPFLVAKPAPLRLLAGPRGCCPPTPTHARGLDPHCLTPA